jgi:phosphoribosylformylglycinamidine synthase
VADTATLDALERDGRVVLRYADADGRVTADANPNGSERGIAGIVSERGNVLGLMPHPERAAEPEVGGTDGLRLFRSLERWLQQQPAAAERRL